MAPFSLHSLVQTLLGRRIGGRPGSANGASSFHLWWEMPPPAPLVEVSAVLRGDEVWMYYGAADTVVALATARLADLLAFVHHYDFLERVGRDKGMVDE